MLAHTLTNTHTHTHSERVSEGRVSAALVALSHVELDLAIRAPGALGAHLGLARSLLVVSRQQEQTVCLGAGLRAFVVVVSASCCCQRLANRCLDERAHHAPIILYAPVAS